MSTFKNGERFKMKSLKGGALHGFDPTDTVELKGYTRPGRCVVRSLRSGSTGYIDEDQLIPQGGEQMARKTYKLIKDTVDVRKGALFQEACDDGDQEYVLITREYIKHPEGHRALGWNKVNIDRHSVEKQPQWFTEVFKVTPEYMTRAELDQWEAFKARKTKKSLPAPAPAPKAIVEAAAPRTFTLSQERLEKFAKVYNSSRSTQSVADKLKITKGSVSAYKSIALKRGIELKKMKRAKTAA